MASEEEERQMVIAEARSWVGTPFRHCSAVKGAGCDCAMLLVSSFVASGLVPPFDPRPYPTAWHLHQDEEKFLGWIAKYAGEVKTPKPGDIVLYKFGRCYSHGAIMVSPTEIVHAYFRERKVVVSETFLAGLAERPQRYFSLWAPVAE